MSYYNDASLVLLAQDLGKKAGSVAAQKPMDANGQMTFTRTGDTATRVAPNGLIEKVRTNLILQSNTFSNASWTKSGVGVGSVSVVTPNYTTDPFGGNNAWRFQCNLNGGTTSSDRSWMLQSFTPIANSILSIYINLKHKINHSKLLDNLININNEKIQLNYIKFDDKIYVKYCLEFFCQYYYETSIINNLIIFENKLQKKFELFFNIDELQKKFVYSWKKKYIEEHK